jgi:hypothetical protein
LSILGGENDVVEEVGVRIRHVGPPVGYEAGRQTFEQMWIRIYSTLLDIFFDYAP